MQPCQQPASSLSTLMLPTPDYMSYTALLLLQSSALLAKVGTTAGMEPRSRSQTPDWPDTLEDPPTSRWANVPAHEGRYQTIPPVVQDQSCHESESRKRRSGNLRNLLRRREDDHGTSSRSPYLHPAPSRSAPPTQVAFTRSSSGPPSLAGDIPERQLSPLLVPPASGQRYASWDFPETPRNAQFYTPLSSSRSINHPPTPRRSARTYPGAPWEESPQNPHNRRRQSETFDSASELHQFAEATSGFDPFSPIRQRSITEYYAPRFSASARSQAPPQPSHSELRSMGMVRSSSQAMAEAMTAFSDENVPADEELPDYAQSQWEAHSNQRREAARRAAELERQWLEARQSRRS